MLTTLFDFNNTGFAGKALLLLREGRFNTASQMQVLTNRWHLTPNEVEIIPGKRSQEPVARLKHDRKRDSMATVEKDGQGYRVRFIDHNKKRKTIRLSGINKANARTVAHHVQELVNWRKSGLTLDSQTAEWLAKKIGQELHDKLAKAGLIERRASCLLTKFMAEYLTDGRTVDGKPAAANTLKKWRQAEKVLNEFFENKSLRDITHDDAVKFRRWLDAGTLGENGIRTHIGVAKMFFNVAKRRKLIEENPFEFQKASLVLDRSRDFFLNRANAAKIMEACPDTQWKLVFALWRFAGLRKMEIFQLRWENILWDQGRMLVTIPKTKHHEGKESRFVPIGDILPWLEKAFDEAPEGNQRVITRFVETNVNLAKPFEKIIKAAGLKVWPKLIQNLRASCETDWLDSGIAAHVVAKWIGHSVKVQNDNYAQVDDHHFDQFNSRAEVLQTEEANARKVVNCPSPSNLNDAQGHRQGQKASEVATTVKRRKDKNPAKLNVLRGSSEDFGSLRFDQVPEAGVEPAHGITHTGF